MDSIYCPEIMCSDAGMDHKIVLVPILTLIVLLLPTAVWRLRMTFFDEKTMTLEEYARWCVFFDLCFVAEIAAVTANIFVTAYALVVLIEM